MGYTPLFDSIVRGTLYGRWPDIGLWPIVLALADKHGVVDCTPQFLAGVTGLPVSEVVECMQRFCAPDPYSRSKDVGGARLVLVDPVRDWGWRIVNHALYREKARLAAKSEREVESGTNATRLAQQAAAHRRSPPTTAAHPLSDADANKDADIRTKKGAQLTLHASLPLESWNEWLEHRRAKRWPVDGRTLKKQLELLARYTTDEQRLMIDTSIQATWQGIFPPKVTPAQAAEDKRKRGIEAAWNRVKAHAAAIGCLLQPHQHDTPDTFEGRVKTWENQQPRASGKVAQTVQALAASKAVA